MYRITFLTLGLSLLLPAFWIILFEDPANPPIPLRTFMFFGIFFLLFLFKPASDKSDKDETKVIDPVDGEWYVFFDNDPRHEGNPHYVVSQFVGRNVHGNYLAKSNRVYYDEIRTLEYLLHLRDKK